MKYQKYILKTILATFLFTTIAHSQNGTLEAANGLIVGNNTPNDDGTIRYTGTDFEGRKSGNWVSLTGTNGSSMWSQSGSTVFYNQGKIGIGLNDPSVELHVEGGAEIFRISGTNPWMSIRETGGSNYGFNWMSNGLYTMGVSGQNDLAFRTNNIEKMRILSNGNVGLGTTTPSAKLHIEENSEALRIDGDTPWISFYDGANYKGYLYHDGTNFSLSNEVSGKLSFRTNSTTRMTIDETGSVGIGTFSPTAKLDVRGTAVFNEDGADVDFRVEGDDNTHALFVNASGDNVGIGTENPQTRLHVNGNIRFGSQEEIGDGGSNEIYIHGNFRPKYPAEYDLGTSDYKWVNVWATNGTIQTSDVSLKKNIEELPYGLKEIMKLNPVRFKWKEGNDKNYKLGLIAQELLPVLSEVVKTHHYEISETDKNTVKEVELENLGVYYSDLIPVLIKGMQEQQAQINSLKKEIAELKNHK